MQQESVICGDEWKNYVYTNQQLYHMVWRSLWTSLIIWSSVTGFLLTVRLGVLQVRHLGKALKFMVKTEEGGEGEVTSFGALCTALSATIGTGNIVGVATAIAAGVNRAGWFTMVFFGKVLCRRICCWRRLKRQTKMAMYLRPILLYRKWYKIERSAIFLGWSWTVWHWYFYPGKWYCVCSKEFLDPDTVHTVSILGRWLKENRI